MQIPILSDDDWLEAIGAQEKTPYFAMYSSQTRGITYNPNFMMLPIDDHIVHRGDAVFEAIKYLDSHIYGLDEHLARLMRSAKAIELDPQRSQDEIRETIIQTIRSAQKSVRSKNDAQNGLVRLYLSRGQGGFTTNPYDCRRAGLYIVITPYKAFNASKYQTGVTAQVSKFLAKEGFYSQVKSCNYLQNVLMKKDAVDSNVDFTVAEDAGGFITEGSTENCAFISKENELLIPSFENTLRGITLMRVIELAEGLVKSGELKKVKELRITKEQAFDSNEMAFIGTTLDVLPVASLNRQNIGTGAPGPIFKKLGELLLNDIADKNSKMNSKLTP